MSMPARSYLTGLAFLSPALFVLIGFFFLPVVLTAVFAFTNMSTSTGISGGSYVITGNLLGSLKAQGVAPTVVDALSQASFVVDEQSIAKAQAAGTDAQFLAEIEQQLSGKAFSEERAFERELKSLRYRPRSIRDLKLAVDQFELSVLNTRFASAAEAREAVSELVPSAPADVVDEIVDASYTGWRWTTSNFTRLVSSSDTWRLVGNTIFYVAVTLSFTVFVGLFLAVTTFYLPAGAASAFSMLWLLPRITPVVLYTVMWKWFTWEGGFVYTAAQALGLPAFNYMKGSVPTAWTIVIMVNGFIGAAFAMILFSGALKAIPVQQLWASEADGASRWQQIRFIILPHLRWPILFVVSYQTLSLLSSYQEIWLTTNGGPGRTTTVWALESFNTALNSYTGNLQYGLGAAMALILVIVGVALSILYLRLFRFDELLSRPKIEF
ncbi:inositol-phosphate transport system permease protein [Pseudorhizobium tarimense]|uniref:Inositol-phosphate transport system permease protein n=1 Tax=Pseudorhizobium tarimense TaxID=1079109 RepID=A0ABV2H8U4_9HYPH|nr:sugar ABC transporter permease [Pseudorhizobium tarimense]MCJ8520035.1 sugar ABC transporter permease [Pseudorhizobium tarimense]